MQNFKDLVVWQRAMQVAREVYKATGHLPREEDFGLKSQMRRCAVSVPSNIAEGKKRGSKADYVKFLRIAGGPAAELETQMLLAGEFYPDVDFTKATVLLLEVQKMLTSMLGKLK
ncbi:MAG: four helix bundle protein [Proteobacteria bacterium]|nr:four helix bundle protein [Pseudomonadota bacterium]